MPFGQRYLVREDLMQRALREGGFSPERFIARADGSRTRNGQEFYLILREKILDPARIKTEKPRSLEVLP